MQPLMLSLPEMIEAMAEFYHVRLMQKENVRRIEKRDDALWVMRNTVNSFPKRAPNFSKLCSSENLLSINRKLSVFFFFLKDSRPEMKI